MIGRILEMVLSRTVVDWHGRRIVNAGDAVDPQDYVTLAQIQELIAEATAGITGLGLEAGNPITLGQHGNELHDPDFLTAVGAISEITVLAADPGSPVDETVWFVATGTSPARTLDLKYRHGGVTYTFPIGTV